MAGTDRGSAAPLVSFVVIGRNDGYMGDYLYRLGTSLSFLAQSAAAAGMLDAIEVVMVDWASPTPLSAVVPLVSEARRITRFVEVSGAVVHGRYGEVRWISTTAVNVGVRRARGRFIFFTDSDCLWTESAIAALGALLRGETPLPAPIERLFCYVRRYQVPWATVHRKPHLDEWRRLAALLVATVQPELPAATFLGGFSAGQLLHRDLWFALRGYDETLDKPWGWADNDLALRATQEHSWLDVSTSGFFGMHMEHWPDTADRAARDAATVNPMTIRNQPAVNDAGWGLAGIDLPIVAGSCGTVPPSGAGCAVPLTGQTAALSWKPGPHAADFVRRIGAQSAPHVPLAQLEAVAQIALADRPRAIYWFGAIEPPVLQTMVGACPGAELLIANAWPEGIADGLPFHPAELTGSIQTWGFRGWARMVQGEPATTLERISRSRLGDTPIELAWVAPGTPQSIVGELAARLAPGGVALFPLDGTATAGVEQIRQAMPGCVTRVLAGTGLAAATRVLEPARIIEMSPETTTTSTAPTDESRSLRAVLDMLLRDKTLGLIEPSLLPWDRPILVVRSAHMGRMEAFFHQLLARCPAPALHVLSHARDEAALRAMAPMPFTFHAYTTPGPYRLEGLDAEQLDTLKAETFAALFFLDAGTRGDRLEEVERMLGEIRRAPIVCFMGNGKFAEAPDADRRQLAEAAFLRLIEWYQFRLDPGAAPGQP